MGRDTTAPPGASLPDAASRFRSFVREQWAQLRASTPLTLTEADLDKLQGINERLSLAEVAEIYLPLSRLLNLYVAATQQLNGVTDTFLGRQSPPVPYVIAIAGSVAVGKSTTARVIQALLARWPDHPVVELVTTDGFLYPNRVLQARGLMSRKGFPESYDLRRLLRFLSDIKMGVSVVTAPVYSHEAYDIVEGQQQVVRNPDVLLIEGLNLLQAGPTSGSERRPMFVSDFLDFSIYVDADEPLIEQWYIERFLTLRETVFANPASYFHRYAHLTIPQARDMAAQIWREINAVNLHENILPTRERAHLILEKGAGHAVTHVRLRRL